VEIPAASGMCHRGQGQRPLGRSEVGILILDVQALNEARPSSSSNQTQFRSRRRAPALGTRKLARRVDQFGMIYRFIHKPMSRAGPGCSPMPRSGDMKSNAGAPPRLLRSSARHAESRPQDLRRRRRLGRDPVATWAFHRNAPAGAGLPESSGHRRPTGLAGGAIETARKSGVENDALHF